MHANLIGCGVCEVASSGGDASKGESEAKPESKASEAKPAKEAKSTEHKAGEKSGSKGKAKGSE